MDPYEVIEKYYQKNSRLYHVLVEHSRIVAQKSLDIAYQNRHLNPDMKFIETAAMLHDVGIFMTRAESIGCFGDQPYVCHGVIGRTLLDDLGIEKRFGLVCERHTGAGISRENIIKNRLPLPGRDMVPVSLEEKIICVADKYHSKSPKQKNNFLSTDQIVLNLKKIDPGHARRFSQWAEELGLNS